MIIIAKNVSDKLHESAEGNQPFWNGLVARKRPGEDVEYGLQDKTRNPGSPLVIAFNVTMENLNGRAYPNC